MLPGGFAIGKRKMKGVVSNGMLCSGRELRLSEDHEGILRLNDVDGAGAGRPLTEALGIEPDVVFDMAVEANRPDAWSMVGRGPGPGRPAGPALRRARARRSAVGAVGADGADPGDRGGPVG